MRLYRFSPIANRKQLLKAVDYVARQNTRLSTKIVGRRLPIRSLTIFAHYDSEYKTLRKVALEMGLKLTEHNGLYVTLDEPIRVGANSIEKLRIREPDPYRMHVGCNDFEIDDYKAFKRNYLTKSEGNLRLIKRPEYEMIEFFDPDFDTLAYVVSKPVV